jgi:hypothetical protein
MMASNNCLWCVHSLQDGVEEKNNFEYNLASWIHALGLPPGNAFGSSQSLAWYTQAPNLLLPADVTAAGYYVTNAYNRFYGNAASGGWSGFIFVRER